MLPLDTGPFPMAMVRRCIAFLLVLWARAATWFSSASFLCIMSPSFSGKTKNKPEHFCTCDAHCELAPRKMEVNQTLWQKWSRTRFQGCRLATFAQNVLFWNSASSRRSPYLWFCTGYQIPLEHLNHEFGQHSVHLCQCRSPTCTLHTSTSCTAPQCQEVAKVICGWTMKEIPKSACRAWRSLPSLAKVSGSNMACAKAQFLVRISYISSMWELWLGSIWDPLESSASVKPWLLVQK